ncbi:hypothetical protein [Paenibacillus aestuarii]|uniref:Uncharacterized protein n=1 Tax=Paenibacillus aestuarii TaxID=516965 RepID=A0ABW0KIG9_9BACL|nr:hypothetical protein [Paenibacillus aestuarii]
MVRLAACGVGCFGCCIGLLAERLGEVILQIAQDIFVFAQNCRYWAVILPKLQDN